MNLAWLKPNDYGGATHERLLEEIRYRRSAAYEATRERLLPDFVAEEMDALAEGGYPQLVLLSVLIMSGVKWVLHRAYQQSWVLDGACQQSLGGVSSTSVPMERGRFATCAPLSGLYGFSDDDDVLLLLRIEPTEGPLSHRPKEIVMQWQTVIRQARSNMRDSYWPNSVFLGATVAYYSAEAKVPTTTPRNQLADSHSVALFPCENDDEWLRVCDSATGSCYDSLEDYVGAQEANELLHRFLVYDMLLVFERKRGLGSGNQS